MSFSPLKDKAGFGCIFLAKWLSHKPRGELLLLLSQLKYNSAGSAELDGLALQRLMLKALPVRSPLPLQSITPSILPFVRGFPGCSHLHFHIKAGNNSPGRHVRGRILWFSRKKGRKEGCIWVAIALHKGGRRRIATFSVGGLKGEGFRRVQNPHK